MKRRRINGQFASYMLAAALLSMLVTFIVFDVDAIRREAELRYQDNCGAVAERACAAPALQKVLAAKD